MRSNNKKLLFLKLNKIKLLAKRFAIVLLFLLSFTFMLISKTDTKIINSSSSFAISLISPVVDILSLPARLISGGYNYIRDIKNIYKDNTRLKNENQKLIDELEQLKNIKIENNLLSELLNYIQPPKASSVTARVISSQGDVFTHTSTIYTGNNEKVKKGYIAVTNEGVVGRVENVGRKYSEITMITDINFKVPVIVERNRARGMLIGDNTDYNKLVFVPISTNLEVGDKIITSGIAGVFPPGLPVGKIVSIDKNEIKVKPFVNTRNVEYVKIIGYDTEDIE